MKTEKHWKKQSKLRDAALILIRTRPRNLTYAHIAKVTDLSARWIEAFAAGQIENPGVCNIEALTNFFN